MTNASTNKTIVQAGEPVMVCGIPDSPDLQAARIDTGTHRSGDTLALGARTAVQWCVLDDLFPRGALVRDENGTTWLDTGIPLRPEHVIVLDDSAEDDVVEVSKDGAERSTPS